MDIIDKSNLSDGTKKIYKTALEKLKGRDLGNVSNIQNIINNEKSDESKKIIYNAICKVLELSNNTLFDHYNKLRNEIKKKIEYDKSDNHTTLPISYSELVSKLMISITNIYDYIFLYVNIMYPLRLDYFNIRIIYDDNDTNYFNYMTFKNNKLVFYLNDFKTIKSMGPQVITYNDPVIIDYITTNKPKYFLYNSKGQLFSNKVVFGHHLTALCKKYFGLSLTINDIRKIKESDTIQSSGYNTLSNREKDSIHHKLLHSSSTAVRAYNKITS